MNNGISLVDDDIQTFSNDEDLLDEFDFNIEIHTRFEDAPKIKQQILNNQVIVERLKTALKNKHGSWYNRGCYGLLQSILQTPEHSGGKA